MGRSFTQILVRKVLSTIGIQSVLFGNNATVAESAGSTLGNVGAGSTPVSKADPPTTPISGGHVQLGWNPASNSEGREGFVVREVQGRRGPLN